MSNEDDYLKRLIQRAEELMDTQSKANSSDYQTKIPAPDAPKEKTKQKRFYSEEQKQKLRDRLEIARAKSKEVRELKKNISQIKHEEKQEEKKERAKFKEQSLEEKLEKIKQVRQYNPPKEEIQGPKVDKPVPAPEPEPIKAQAPVQPVQPAQPVQPVQQVQPVQNKPKYFMPSLKYAKKHFMNPL